MRSSQAVVALLLVAVQTVVGAVPVIQAPWGSIQGVEVEGDAGRKMNGYLGIPYALPPVGELRFERPQPHPGPGQGQVFVADTVLPACMQVPGLIHSSRETSEDCLMLNVYVPTEAANSNTLYPVMFFIHGGGFYLGDATFHRPSKLVVDGQVIVVTMQYRLGAFGFFHSADDLLPGNQGLWDQVLALRWVKDNIRAFGGDPDLVTVFGESAGSSSASLLMLSPQAKGLVKRAILQSGGPQVVSYLSDLTAFQQAGDAVRGTAGLLQCQGDSKEQLLQCLKQQPAEAFFNKSLEYGATSPIGSYNFPVVDGEFLPRDPKELALDEQYVQENGIGDIDVMVGLNNREGSLVLSMLLFTGQSTDTLQTAGFFRGIIDQCILVLGSDKPTDVQRKAVEFFYRGADLDTNQTMNADTVADMFGDCLMNAPVIEWTQYLAASPHTANRYLYVLDHPFECNNQGPYPGSHHGDELMMQFDRLAEYEDIQFLKMLNKTGLTEAELPLGDKFVQIIATFARTGNPSPVVREDLGGEWPQFTSEDEAYLSFSQTPRVVYNAGPYQARAALWNKLLPQLKAPRSDPGKESEKAHTAGKEEL